MSGAGAGASPVHHATSKEAAVAAYLGHADLSTVSRYAHVAEAELHDAAAALAARTVTRVAA